MRPIKDIPLRYSVKDLSTATAESLGRTAAGFGETAITSLLHVLAEPLDNSPFSEEHGLEAIAAEARAAGHFGLLALERTPASDVDPKTCDVIIENHGSIFLFRPRTGYAADWLRENVASEGWQWFGGALAVEPRYAGQLVCGIEDAGFSVR